jgi:hypothetical protein
MRGDGLRWYQFGKRRLRVQDADCSADAIQPVDNWQPPGPMPTAQEWLAATYVGAMVARSQILVSGSTFTLLGTLTNETGCYIYFTGMPPYAITFDTDGSQTVLSGDFSSPPQEQPTSVDCVMHPGAVVPYRSLPVTLRNTDARWEGTDWCVSSCSTTLDRRFYSRGEVLTVQLFD